MTPRPSVIPESSGDGPWSAGEKTSVGIILGLFLLRLAFLAFPDLFPEEAYYWLYAKRLDVGYLDHPPMVAWLIAGGTALLGDREFAVRIGAFLCSLLTSFWLFRLARLLYDRGTAVAAVLCAQVLPFFFLTGLIMTPDAPLTTCWAGMLYYLARVLIGGSSRAWFGVGLFLGFGMLSKYTIALLGPATLLFLVTDPPSRAWFRRWEPYAAVALAVVIFSPVIWWNAHHAWASFTYQGSERIAAARRFSLHELLASILVMLTPVGLILAGKVLFPRRGPVSGGDPQGDRRLWFARIFTLVPLSVFVLFSLTHRVKLNWTGPIWLAVLPGLAACLIASWRIPRPFLRIASSLSAGVLLAGYSVLLIYLTRGLPGVDYPKDINIVPIGWSEIGRAVEEEKRALKASHGGDFFVVGLDRNFIASELAFYHSDHAESVAQTTGPHILGRRALMYEFWFPNALPDGANALLVGFRQDDVTHFAISNSFRSLGKIERIRLKRGDIRVRTFYIRPAFDYQKTHSGK